MIQGQFIFHIVTSGYMPAYPDIGLQVYAPNIKCIKANTTVQFSHQHIYLGYLGKKAGLASINMTIPLSVPAAIWLVASSM